MAAAQPTGIAHAALMRTDIDALSILGVHCDEGLPIRQLAYLHRNLLIDVTRHEQPACSADDFDVVLRIAVKAATQGRDYLSMALEAVDFSPAGLFRDGAFRAVVQIPHPAAKRIDANDD